MPTNEQALLYSCGNALIYLGLLYFVLIHNYEGKHPIPHRFLLAGRWCVGSMLLSIPGFLWATNSVQYLLSTAMFMVIPSSVFSRIHLKGDRISHLITIFAFLLTSMESHYFTVSLADLLFPGSMWAEIVISKLLVLLIAVFMIKLPAKGDFRLPNNCWPVLCVLLLAIPVIKYVGLQENTELIRSLIQNGTFLYSFGVYWVFAMISKDHDEKTRLQLMQREQATQAEHIQQLERVQNSMRQLRHDYKNHVVYMNAMLEAGSLKELRQYFHEVMASSPAGDEVIRTGVPVIDAVLNVKYADCVARGIPIRYDIDLNTSLKLQDYDLCSILSNLLDNAIEASESLDAPSISLILKTSMGYLMLLVQNRVSGDVMRSNPHLSSTKSHAQNHGFGLGIVRQIVRRYGGTLELSGDDASFQVKVAVPDAYTESGSAPCKTRASYGSAHTHTASRPASQPIHKPSPAPQR